MSSVRKFTFAVSSPDEFLVSFGDRPTCVRYKYRVGQKYTTESILLDEIIFS